MRAARLSVLTAVAAVSALTAVTGCTEKSDAKSGDRVINVTATDSKCTTSAKQISAGHIELAIENRGSKVTEVYVLFPDDRVVTERENIGPGTKQRVTAEVKAGEYQIACKPGMKGDGIRQDLKVTGGKVAARDPRLDKAVAAYRSYAQEQADATLPLAKTFAADKTLAKQLITDLTDWQNRVGKAEITPTSMANGAKELLDEVATGKVTGEEERYSHTDLVDFKANVEGAQKSYELLKPVAKENDAALVTELDKQFAALDALLDKYRPNTSSYEFTSYDKVGEADRKELSDAVNALAEPLSKLAAAVAK